MFPLVSQRIHVHKRFLSSVGTQTLLTADVYLWTSGSRRDRTHPHFLRSLTRTYPLLKGEVGRGAARVLTGQQPVRVPGAGRVGVGGGVGAGRAHGRRQVAVVVEQRAVARVGGCRLRGGGVGPAQQWRGASVHRLIRPVEGGERHYIKRK